MKFTTRQIMSLQLYHMSDIEDPRQDFPSLPSIFKNTNVCRQDNGPLMQEYARRKC